MSCLVVCLREHFHLSSKSIIIQISGSQGQRTRNQNAWMGSVAHNSFIIKKMATEWVTYCMATAASALDWGVQKIDLPSREMSWTFNAVYPGGREDQGTLSAGWTHFSLPPREATSLTKKAMLLKFNIHKLCWHRNFSNTISFCLSHYFK